MGTTSIADAIFTRVQQRVLAALFGNPALSFYVQELIALVASGTGAVQRELARLESAGLVTSTRVGRQKHYQANPDLYPALAPAEPLLGRPVNPTAFTRAELARRLAEGNAFATRVLDGPKLWVVGGPGDLPAR